MWMCASVSECLPSALLIFIKINEHLRLFSHSFKTSIGRKIDILLETEYRAVSQRMWARCAVFSLFFLSSCCTPCSTIDISLELHLLQFIFFMLVHFLCLRLYILRRYFRHLLISLFSLLIHSQCYPSLKLSFPFVCCCFVVKFTLVYCSWQTWKKRVPSNDRMEQKFSFDEQRTICLLIGPAFWAMHILTMERGSNIDNFSVPKRINSPPHPPRIIVSTILSIGLISKS